MACTFTRQEFYDLVWSKPLTHLAKEFALSDVALHKVCKRHGIPHPPLGWWAKKAAGKPVTQAPLPDVEEGVATTVTIVAGELASEPAPLSAAREQARVAASMAPPAGLPPAHPVAAKTIAALRKAKPGDKGLLAVDGTEMIRCAVAPGSVDRLAAFLPCLAQAAATQGFALAAGAGGARFTRENEAIGFSITEQVTRDKHMLTEAEQSKLEAWEQKRARSREPWRYSFDRPAFAEWDYHPTGKLALEFEHEYLWGSSPRRAFKDAKVQRLEGLVDEIVVGLAVLFAAKVEDQRQRRDHKEQVEQERRRRELAQRALYVEERRTAALEAILAELERLDRLRRLLAGAAGPDGSAATARVATFVQWAADHLATCETKLLPTELEARFASEQLFGDSDDHDFRPRWY